jgi:hypothetical protein
VIGNQEIAVILLRELLTSVKGHSERRRVSLETNGGSDCECAKLRLPAQLIIRLLAAVTIWPPIVGARYEAIELVRRYVVTKTIAPILRRP